MKKLVFIVVTLLTVNIFASNPLTVVAVGEAEVVKDKVLVEKIYFEGDISPALQERYEKNIAQVIRNDLRFYNNYFQVMPRKVSLTGFDSVKYDVYKSQGINYLIRLKIAQVETGTQSTYKLFKISEQKEIAQGRFSIPGDVSSSGDRQVAHNIADGVFKAVVGTEPIFRHKIVFVSDKGFKDGRKELYMMDFDGANVRQLTWHQGTVISPSVSPDGTKVLYSLIDEKKFGKKKNIDLRLLDLNTTKSSLISRKRGINSGAVFTSDGQSIILTLSHQGNAELYRMNLQTRKLDRLTKNYAPDVDPSITAEGDLLTFLSGRPGKPMIYTMVPSSVENKVKRISYVGKFNATPRFSPDGKEIVFSSWLDNRFDLFKINSDGSGLGRLTKDFGSNEDPDYSKDGQFIIFTSQRVLSQTKALQNVYIMDTEGKVLGALTENFGRCISPRWLKPLKAQEI